MIKAVLFDLDGVLIDSEHLSQKIYEDFIQETGYPIPLERFYLLIGSHKMWDPFSKVIEGIDIGKSAKEFEEEIEFQIVGSTEANSLEGKISNESPVGKALIGASIGDVVEVETPTGVMQYKVLKIQRNV